MNTITITSEFAHKVALALVNDYNRYQGQQTGSVRLVAFRSLYQDLKTLGEQFQISSAIHPEDYPQEMWFV